MKSERGPNGVVYGVTDLGRANVATWLATPVDHVRDTRSSLLLKLAFLHAAGDPSGPLLEAQAALLEPKLASLEDALGARAGSTPSSCATGSRRFAACSSSSAPSARPDRFTGSPRADPRRTEHVSTLTP